MVAISEYIDENLVAEAFESLFIGMRFVILLFCLVWCQIPKPLMRSVIIIEIDIFRYRNLKFCLCFIEILTKILFFNGCKKRLYYCIIIGISGC